LFNNVVASPSKYSLVDVTASSQGIDVDPDTYLFWDGLHPTTHGHSILAVAADKMFADSYVHNSKESAQEQEIPQR
jgi:phospholipase/lecithinase/hemolysin